MIHTDPQTKATIAGITIPDTPIVREVTALIREAEDDLLFDHSRRVFLFGALQGRRRGLQPDLELLYVGAMFHDIGLTDRYRTSSLRLEVDGANAARDFLLDHGVDEAAARKVWLGIALHTTPGVPEFLEPEIALVTAGVETDVLGIGRDDLPAESLAAVTAAHPRDRTSNAASFRRSPTATCTDRTPHSATSTPTSSPTTTTPSCETTSSRSSSATAGPNKPRAATAPQSARRRHPGGDEHCAGPIEELSRTWGGPV